MTSRPEPKRSDATHAKHAAAVTAAAQTAALAGRELPSLERIAPEQHHTAQDCAGEVNRIKVALGRLKTGAQFNEAVELLKAVARDLEKLA